jgi:hypothetical protein
MKNLAQRIFLAGDRVGVHLMPSHYYSSVASRTTLRRTESTWRRPLDPIPFRWDLDAQAKWLTTTAGRYPAEVPLAEIFGQSEAVGGFRYGPLEAQFLHSFIRAETPAKIVEIGSGSSTLLMSKAVDRNVADGKPAGSIVACDPYTADRVAGLPHVEARSAGGLDITAADLDLRSGDLLFIDSTHTVRTGSELPHLYLEVLPQLPAGVTVHIHDIYLPYLFAPNIYESMFDWQETTLLAALLTGNDNFAVLACMSALFDSRPEALHEAFPEFRPMRVNRGINDPGGQGHFPSSIWLTTRRE